jgi:Flp pilus assembly protein CpaB
MDRLGSAPHWWRGRRAPWIRQVLALALAAGSVAWALHATDHAAAVRAAYGTLQRVAVARHPLAAGATVTAADVSWRDLPRIALPAGPATAPLGATALEPIGAGQILTTDELSGAHSRGGLSALVPPGEQAVAVPLADGALALAPGDHVDVVAPSRDSSGTGRVVVRDAPVLRAGSGRVVLGVDEDELGGLAAALAAGQPLVTLVG